MTQIASVQSLPPNYSEEDRRQRERLFDDLFALEHWFDKQAQPIRDALVEIENRYARRYIIQGIKESEE
jgi:hypothetical protein